MTTKISGTRQRWNCEVVLDNGLTVLFGYRPQDDRDPMSREEFDIESVKCECGKEIGLDDSVVIDMLKAAQRRLKDERRD